MMKTRNPTIDAATDEVRAAYEQGRLDQRAKRKRHPVAMGLMFLAAAVGVGVIALAMTNGSFSGGGKVVDQQLTEAQQQAQPIVQGAAESAGKAVRDATQR